MPAYRRHWKVELGPDGCPEGPDDLARVAKVVIFWGMDLALGSGFSPSVVPTLTLTLACAGASVGAVHGLALVWLLRPARRLEHGGGRDPC